MSKIRTLPALALAALLSAAGSASAAPAAQPAFDSTSSPTSGTAIPAPAGPQRWALVPILISTAETGGQVGALIMRFLNPGDTLDKPSSIGFAARISQLGQTQVNLFPEWYLDRNLYHVTGELNYIRWPADFYGIGNDRDIPQDSADAYLAQGINGNLIAERTWFKDFSAGPLAQFSAEDITVQGKRGLLSPAIAGELGGLASAVGMQATLDKRDAIYWARSGTFLRGKAAWYGPWAGSDFRFDAYCLEARRFLPLFSTGALGLAGTLQIKDGDVPFRELSTADGDHALRGIVKGKYRDRDMLLLQAEYKSYLPDWGWLSHPWVRNRLGWAAFAEAGEVAPRLGEIDAEGLRPAYGVGLRYAMNPAQRMNIRVDVGFVDGSVAPAINIKEAF